MPFDLKSALKEMSEEEVARYLTHASNLDYDLLKEQNFTDAQINQGILEMAPEDYETLASQSFNEKNYGDVQRGLIRGGHNVASSYGGMAALGGDVLERAGAESLGKSVQDYGMGVYQEHEKEASLFPKDKFSDSKFGWALGTFAEQVPVMAEITIGAALSGGGGALLGKKILQEGVEAAAKKAVVKKMASRGAKAGMAATVFPLETGLNYGELRNEHGVKAPLSSVFFGSLATAMEFIPGGNIKIVDSLLDAAKKGDGGVMKTIARELLASMPSEAAQEAGQETMSVLNVVANTDEKFLTRDNFLRILESAGAGGMMGGAGGTVKGGINAFRQGRGRGVSSEEGSPGPVNEPESGQTGTAPRAEPGPVDPDAGTNAFNALSHETKTGLEQIRDDSIGRMNAFAQPVVQRSAPEQAIEQTPVQPPGQMSTPPGQTPVQPSIPDDELNRMVNQEHIEMQDEVDRINEVIDNSDDPFLNPVKRVPQENQKTSGYQRKAQKTFEKIYLGQNHGDIKKSLDVIETTNRYREELLSDKGALEARAKETRMSPEDLKRNLELDLAENLPLENIIREHLTKASPRKGMEEESDAKDRELSRVNTDPSEAQKEAGNYKKAHINFMGFDVSIENPAGSTRKGVDGSGKAWESTMQSHYGYFKRSLGKDGDQVDVFINPDSREDGKIFVVDQVDPGTGKFDEHKVMMGFGSPEDAKAAYLSNYEDGWQGLGEITEVGRDDFKAWLGDRKRTKKPFALGKSTVSPEKITESGENVTENLENITDLSPGDPVQWSTKTGKIFTGKLTTKRSDGRWDVTKDQDDRNSIVDESMLEKVVQKQVVAADEVTTRSTTDKNTDTAGRIPENNDEDLIAKDDGSPREKTSKSVGSEIGKTDDRAPGSTEKKSDAPGRITEKDDPAERSTSESPSKIEDFGEKIGGARKDIAVKTGSSSKKKEQKDTGWKARYQVSKIENETVRRNGEYVDSDRNGKWGIWDKRKKKSRWGLPQPIGGKVFDSEEEAKAARPLLALAEKHSIYSVGENRYSIFRKINDRKRVRVVKEDFESRDAAKEYMVKNADEILSSKLSFGEEVLPKPEQVYRYGKERRQGDIAPDAFSNVFGFRGVEFGNWVSKTEERQEVMNHAYDALLDMAEILNIPPKAVSLNGELALAFGARGKGLSGAAAHYEPAYAVINLTKMAGAGHLAHEWFHAFDHYLGRLDGKAETEKITNSRGDSVYKRQTEQMTFATHGFQFSKSGAREELREAYKKFVKTMLVKGEKYVDDTQQVERFLSRAKDALKSRLDNIRDGLSKQLDKRYWKRKNAPATPEQLLRFDELSDMLINGEQLELETKVVDSKRRSHFPATRHTNAILDEMSNIYKAVRGRTGFSENGDNTIGKLAGPIGAYRQRIKLLKEAESGKEKIRTIPTKFVMQAKEADQARSKSYWSTEHELAARAFAAYLEDRLSDKKAQNDFLAYHAHGAVIVPVYPEGLFMPYPEGVERQEINKAFDNLFDEIKTKETDKGVALYSVSDDFSLNGDDFREQLQSFLKSPDGWKKPLKIKGTPKVLQILGAENHPILINPSTLKKVLFEKHGLPIDLIKQIPEKISDPIMVFDSATVPGSLVAMTELNHDGKTLVAAIHLNIKKGKHLINRISSVYGREKDSHFTNWIKRGLLRYQNTQKTKDWFHSRGLQLPKGENSLLNSNKILTEKDLVKNIQYSINQTPGQGVSFQDIQSRFKGQDVFLSPDGSISIRLKNGTGVQITQVQEIGGKDVRLAMKAGRVAKDGIILGKYKNKTITLNKDLASNFTRDHELYHFLVDMGMITEGERLRLLAKFQALKKKNQIRFKPSDLREENEANMFAQILEDREAYRKTPLGRLIQKIMDFVNGLLYIGRKSIRKLARSVESGKIFDRDTVTTPVYEVSAGKGSFKENGKPSRISDAKFPDVELRQTGEIQVPNKGKIGGAGEIAAIFSSLSDAAQEEAWGVALDKSNQIIEVHKFSKGLADEAPGHVNQMTGHLLKNEDVHTVYLVHNHPGGTVFPSPADKATIKSVDASLRLNKITTKGVVISDGEYIEFDKRDVDIPEKIPAKDMDSTAPVSERRIAKRSPQPDFIINEDDPFTQLMRFDGERDGILLADGGGQEIAFIPYEKGKTIRESTIDILAAAARHNATYAVIHAKTLDNTNRWKLYGRLAEGLRSQGITVLDVITEHPATGPMSLVEAKKMYGPRIEGMEALDSDEVLYQTSEDLVYGLAQDTYFQQAVDLVTGTLKYRKDKGEGHRDDISTLASIFKTTMYNADKIGGAAKRAFDIFRKQPDWKFEKQRELLFDGDESLQARIENYRKKDKAGYQKLNDYIVNQDVMGRGHIVREEGDVFVLYHWKKEGGAKKRLGIFESEDEAWEYSREIEAQESGLNEMGQDALKATRMITRKMYLHYAQDMKAAIESYKAANLPLPEITTVRNGKEVQIDLETLSKELGDRQGYYFPRLRQSGQWKVSGKKKGRKAHQYFDSRVLADKYRAGLDRKGFKTELTQVGKLSEDVYQALEPLLSLQQTINKTLREMSNKDKERVLEDRNLSTEWRGETFVVKGRGIGVDVEEVLTPLGGKYKDHFVKTARGEKYSPEIHFENVDPADVEALEERILKSVLYSGHLFKDMDVEFATAFAKQFDAVLKGRGSRARMIARTDAVGEDVSRGYEEDLISALVQAANSAAGGYAKGQVAQQATAAIMGRDISWQDFQEQHGGGIIQDLEKELADLEIYSPKELEQKKIYREDLRKLRGSLFNRKFISLEEVEDIQKQAATLQKKIDSITKYRDPALAQKIQARLNEARTGLYEQYQHMTRERSLQEDKQGKIYRDITATLKDILRNEEAADRLIGMVKAAAVFKYLGFRVSSALINVTNMITGVPAVMNGETKDGISITSALKHVAIGIKEYSLSRRGKSKYQDLFDEIAKKGWDEPKFNREAFSALQGRLGRGWNLAMETSMFMFGVTEKMNRAATIAGTYLAMKKANNGKKVWNHDAMMEKAKDISDKAHGVYEKSNRPFHMRGQNIGARTLQMAYVFQTFQHNYIQEIVRLGVDKKQAKAALYMLLSPVVFGAGATLPMGLAKLISKLLDWDDPDEGLAQFMEKNLGPGAGNLSRYGITGIGGHGVSLKGSLAFRFGAPGSFVDIFGAPGSVVSDIWEGGKNVVKGHYQEGFEKLAPAALGNVSRGIRESASGVTTRSGSPVFFGDEPLKGDTIDTILRVLSFNPTHVAKKRDIQWNEYQVQTRFKNRKTEIYKRLRLFYSQPPGKRSRHERIKIESDIRDFNNEVREKEISRYVPLITGQSIRNAVSKKPSKKERLRAS